MLVQCVLKDRLWEWDNQGVQIDDTHLTWFEKEGAERYASGAAADQTFEDFLARGPWVDGVPAEVVEAVTRVVRAKQRAVVLRVGMTHVDAWAAVRAVWPSLDLAFYRATPGYFRDGSMHPDTATGPADVLAPAGRFFVGPPPPVAPPATLGSVPVTGATTFAELCDAVHATFALLPEVTYDLFEHAGSKDKPGHATVARMQAEAEEQRQAFVTKHGRDPAPADRVGRAGWFGFGVNW